MPHRIVLVALFLAGISCAAGAATHTVELGGLVLVMSDSPTAQVFHIVDQLSLWDQYAHKQYSRWAEKAGVLNDEDRELLRRHAELCRKRGWNNGFEQAFLVDTAIEKAASDAVAGNLLTQEEADSERDILLHFAPKLAPLMQQEAPAIAAFEKQIDGERPRLAATIARLAEFADTGSSKVTVPVFLVSNPDDRSGGGEANDGRLVIEITGPEPRAVLLHEAMHFLLKPQHEAIHAAAVSAGVDDTTMNEGLAYAFAPGLTDEIEVKDRLAVQLVRFELAGRPANDAYVKSHMMALAIRPALRAALKNEQNLSQFLPIAVNKWRDIVGPPASAQ